MEGLQCFGRGTEDEMRTLSLDPCPFSLLRSRLCLRAFPRPVAILIAVCRSNRQSVRSLLHLGPWFRKPASLLPKLLIHRAMIRALGLRVSNDWKDRL